MSSPVYNGILRGCFACFTQVCFVSQFFVEVTTSHQRNRCCRHHVKYIVKSYAHVC